MAQSPQAIADLVRKTLSSPHTEQVIRTQMIRLASENLHEPDVLTALIDVLPLQKDTAIRRQLLGFLMQLNTSRFSDLAGFYTALIRLFKDEKDREVRSAVIQRLGEGVHQDDRLPPFLFDILAQAVLNEDERAAVMDAVTRLPTISDKTVIKALEVARLAPAYLQNFAVEMAEKCPTWSEGVVTALAPYLDVKVDRELRARLFKKIAAAKSLTPAYAPFFITILQTDPETDMRRQAMDLLARIKPWNDKVLEQLLWSSEKDAETSLRTHALELQKGGPELLPEQWVRLADRLWKDTDPSVRTSILKLFKNVIRVSEVREAVVESFKSDPASVEPEEFSAMIELLAPYIGREEAVAEALLEAAAFLPRAEQRKNVLEAILPKLRPNGEVHEIVGLLTREQDESLRKILFERLKPLTVAKYPDLVPLYCEELTEPSSAFRQTCAQSLAVSAELYPAIAPAFEDVLQHDTDRELLRTCLDGYLKPNVVKKFEVLLDVIQNEMVDLANRQRCLDHLVQQGLTSEQSEQLAQALTMPQSASLKWPK